ncbi:MAG: hypothetical protein IJU13_09325 [Bacteroidales bacterium]|nr:hypothetical protein [Bacteroidales bacterium]
MKKNPSYESPATRINHWIPGAVLSVSNGSMENLSETKIDASWFDE